MDTIKFLMMSGGIVSESNKSIELGYTYIYNARMSTLPLIIVTRNNNQAVLQCCKCIAGISVVYFSLYPHKDYACSGYAGNLFSILIMSYKTAQPFSPIRPLTKGKKYESIKGNPRVSI